MIFLDRPKHEPMMEKEREEKIDKYRLLRNSTGILPVTAYPDIIVVDQDGAELPVCAGRCSKDPNDSTKLDDPNLESDMTNPDFSLPYPIVNETLSPSRTAQRTTRLRPWCRNCFPYRKQRTRYEKCVCYRPSPCRYTTSPTVHRRTNHIRSLQQHHFWPPRYRATDQPTSSF